MVEGRIKLIWDFRGPDAQKIAEHHVVHLKEYAASENLSSPIFGAETLSEMHSIAFLVVDNHQMIQTRDALRPHRGQLFQE
jgi:hypothetical protein